MSTTYTIRFCYNLYKLSMKNEEEINIIKNNCFYILTKAFVSGFTKRMRFGDFMEYDKERGSVSVNKKRKKIVSFSKCQIQFYVFPRKNTLLSGRWYEYPLLFSWVY